MTSTAGPSTGTGPGNRPVPPVARSRRLLPGLAVADLAPAPARVALVRRALERAEQAFVAQVAADGGVGPWRRQVESRFKSARDALARSGLSRTETAALVVALLDHAVRDRCWEQVEADPDERWLVLWRHLARHAVAPYRTEPLFLLGWTAWRRGEQAIARAAVDRARAEDPRHRASAMLDQIVSAGMDPRVLPSLAAGPPLGSRAER